ncbi:Scarecrow-like protein 33 [Morella rubra]|uniref:Scarecrow-like protein 33 n=1 Tax=Morella rubra TaxID=262757 RepID=A0A6A1WMN3_9ROSI|nr:Scarecrow-like protein 33 [Morella rubra]
MVDKHSLSPNSSQFPNLENEHKLDIPSQEVDFLKNPVLPPGAVHFAQQATVGQEAETYAPSAAANCLSLSSVAASLGASSDDSDFSETVLKYISQILLEEDIEEKPSMFYDPLGLQSTEKSFYDALGKIYPLPNQYQQPAYLIAISMAQTVFHSGGSCDYGTDINSTSTSNFRPWFAGLGDFQASFTQSTLPGDQFCQPKLRPNRGSLVLDNPTNGTSNHIGDGLKLLTRDIFTDRESILQFRRGSEEASKFLPKGNQLGIDFESDMVFNRVEAGGSQGGEGCEGEFTGWNEASQASQKNGQPKEGNCGKSRAKKQGKKKETVDLRYLLMLCAQAVSAGDSRTANELLRKIRQHSSPFGDGSQRLAHYFANGLEARLASSGTGIFYPSLFSKRISTSEILKAYKLHLSVCPFKRVSFFFGNTMIYKVAEKAPSLHIIDFGILYGFHWPLLIQKLSNRPGGPPKLRITGIQFPQPGFRPTERMDQTGRRLAKYCERFNVSFEYHAIASQNWETIRIEDLTIDESEVLAVNCSFKLKNLLDETVEETSPRNAVLDLIRRLNPDLFVHSIVMEATTLLSLSRGSERLFHFSALYDWSILYYPLNTNQGG